MRSLVLAGVTCVGLGCACSSGGSGSKSVVVDAGAGGSGASRGGGGADSGANGGGSTGGGNGTGGSITSTPPGTLATFAAGVGTKVQPSTKAGTGESIAVASYRDAWIGAQLVVRGNGGHLEGVNVVVDADLSDGNGHTLTKDQVTMYREVFTDFGGVASSIGTGNTPVPGKSPTHDSKIPDALVPFVDPYSGANAGAPFDVAAGTNQPLFVDVHVPKGLAAGTYTGTLHVTSTVGGTSDVPISVTVWAIDLPDMREVTTHFKMSIDDLYYYHAGVQACSGSSCYLDTGKPKVQALVKRYEELAHAHRIDTGQPLANPPVNGCTVPAESDFADYDAVMTPYMNGSYFADGVPSSRFDVPFNPGQSFGVDATCSEAQYTALSAAWATHLTNKGWFPKPAGGGFGAVAYAYDEPLVASSNVSDVQTILNDVVKNSSWLQAGAAGTPSPWKAHVIDTTSPIAPPANPSTSPLLDPALGVYVVALCLYDNYWQHGAFYGRSQWPELFSKGLELWFYEGNSILPPYPTFATNTLDALEPVIMMWGSWFERATGFLYWDIAYWTEKDPWGPEISFGKTGDGVLIYPGNHDGTLAPAGSPADVQIDGPIPSYRLKMVRQGLQDWAFFRYADSQGLTSFVQDQVKAVYSQLGSAVPAPAGSPYWTTDETKMNAIRAAVAAKLVGP